MMTSFILCLLPALLATMSAQGSLTCETCYGLAETCQTAPGTCTVTKGVGGCRSAAGESTLGGTKTSVFSKECLIEYNSGINVPMTLTVGNGMYLRLNASRCNDTDNCNSAVLDVPQRNINPNGRQCPTCFALNSGSCTTQVTPCTGDETYCIDFAGQILKVSTPPSASTFAAQGCGTASTQDIKAGTFLTSRVNMYLFTQASSVLAELIPTTSGTNTNPVTTPNATTIPNAATTPNTATTPPPKTDTTTGGSPALGKFSFALYLPGLIGLLLVKLLC